MVVSYLILYLSRQTTFSFLTGNLLIPIDPGSSTGVMLPITVPLRQAPVSLYDPTALSFRLHTRTCCDVYYAAHHGHHPQIPVPHSGHSLWNISTQSLVMISILVAEDTAMATRPCTVVAGR